MNFAVPADHRVKLKGKKRDEYVNLARELKKLWNMKVTVITIVIGMIPQGLVKGLEDLEIRGQVETIQTTALLRLARILRKDLETYCHLNSSENSQGVK